MNEFTRRAAADLTGIDAALSLRSLCVCRCDELGGSKRDENSEATVSGGSLRVIDAVVL